MEIFSKRLLELRRVNNVSQRELAEAVGITGRTISKYEKYNYEPSQDILVKIAKFFEVTTDYLLGLTEY